MLLCLALVGCTHEPNDGVATVSGAEIREALCHGQAKDAEAATGCHEGNEQ